MGISSDHVQGKFNFLLQGLVPLNKEEFFLAVASLVSPKAFDLL